MAIIKPKKISITDPDLRDLLSKDREDITLEYVRDLFAVKMGDSEAKFNTYDIFTLPAGNRFFNNKDPIETTVGRYLVNMFAIPEKYVKKYGYINEPLTKKKLGSIEEKMGKMILNDELSTREYAKYLDAGEWLGMGCAYFLVPTMNYDINLPIKEVTELRDELFEKYKVGISRGESAVADEIEKNVIALARSKIKEKGNEAYDFFESGVGAFENNYKKTSIMGGAIENPYTKKLDIIKSNYIEGSTPEDFIKQTNLTLVGGYSRGVETQSSGYEAKKLRNSLQAIVLDEKDTDCGTPLTLKTIIPSQMKDMFLYRYVKEKDGKLTLLTDQNIDSYVGREIELRSPLFCKGDHICNKCAGELFYKLGVKNIGLLNDTMAGVLMNKAMKKFHDASIKFSRIEIEDYLKER